MAAVADKPIEEAKKNLSEIEAKLARFARKPQGPVTPRDIGEWYDSSTWDTKQAATITRDEFFKVLGKASRANSSQPE